MAAQIMAGVHMRPTRFRVRPGSEFYPNHNPEQMMRLADDVDMMGYVVNHMVSKLW